MPQLIGVSSFSVVKVADEHWPLNLLYEAIIWLLIKFSILLDTPPNSCYGCEVVATVVPSVTDEFCAMPVPEVAEVAVKFDGAHYHDMYIADVR